MIHRIKRSCYTAWRHDRCLAVIFGGKTKRDYKPRATDKENGFARTHATSRSGITASEGGCAKAELADDNDDDDASDKNRERKLLWEIERRANVGGNKRVGLCFFIIIGSVFSSSLPGAIFAQTKKHILPLLTPPTPRPRPKPHPPLLDIIIVHKKNIFPGYSSVNKCTFFSFVVATVFCFFSTRFLFSRWFSNTSFVASERAFTLSLSRCFSVVFVSSRCKIRPRFIFLSLGAT